MENAKTTKDKANDIQDGKRGKKIEKATQIEFLKWRYKGETSMFASQKTLSLHLHKSPIKTMIKDFPVKNNDNLLN